MTASIPQQLPLTGLPRLAYPLHVCCSGCGHTSDMVVGIEVVNSLYRLRCSHCGAKGRELSIEQRFGGALG